MWKVPPVTVPKCNWASHNRSLLPKNTNEFLDGNLDVVGVTETWLQGHVTDSLVSCPGYNIIRQDRGSGKGGGGLCLYVKDNIEFQDLPNSWNDVDCEIKPIIIERKFQKNVLLVLLYRPPQGKVDQFISHLKNMLDLIYDENKMDLLLMGDFNIDVSKPNNPEVRKLHVFMSGYTINQLTTEPTRILEKCDSIIDLMISNIKFVSLVKVFNINLSDHLPTLLIYKKEREKTLGGTFTCRDYSDLNLKNYGVAVAQYDWSFVFESENIDTIWGRMYSVFINLLDTFCPFKTVTIKKNRPPYITNDIIEMGHKGNHEQ